MGAVPGGLFGLKFQPGSWMSSDCILVSFLILSQFPTDGTLLMLVSWASPIHLLLLSPSFLLSPLPLHYLLGRGETGVHAYHSVSMKVREQLATVTSLLLPFGFWGTNSDHQTWQ